MRAFGNPLGNPVRGSDGGQGARIGDIVFAKALPNANFIPVTKRRVYRDEYPRLADALLTQRENDGSEWLNTTPFASVLAGSAIPSQFRSAVAQPICGGPVGSDNIILFTSGYGAYVLAGPANGYEFTTYRAAVPPTGNQDYGYTAGDLSDAGTLILRFDDAPGGATSERYMLRSLDGGRSWAKLTYAQVGLPEALSAQSKIRWVQNKTWVLADGNGRVYRSVDDGLSWTLAAQVVTMNEGGTTGGGFQTVEIVVTSGKVVLCSQDYMYVANTGASYHPFVILNKDTLAYETHFGARFHRYASSYGNARALSAGEQNGDFVVQVDINMSSLDDEQLLVRCRGSDLTPIEAVRLGGTAGTAGGIWNIASLEGAAYILMPSTGLFTEANKGSWANRRLVSAPSANIPTTCGGYAVGNSSRSGVMNFPLFALLLGTDVGIASLNVSALTARPSASARQYYQFNDAGVVGAQRSDGKLPFMRAR